MLLGSNGRSVHMKELLLVESYANLKSDILQQLLLGETKMISDRFFYAIAELNYHQKDVFIDMLKPSLAQLEEKIVREAPGGQCKEFLCVLQCWRGDSGTYQSLRETLDQFSVFAGRNPLVSFMSYY